VATSLIGVSYAISAEAQLTTADSVAPSGAEASSASPAQAVAVSDKGSALEEVVVTAQRRKELLQDVPISVTALSAAKTEEMGLADTTSLSAAVPNLTIMISGSSTFNPFIRGIGSVAGLPNQEASVATYVDGIYIASPYAVTALAFNNIEQIEVLKGPQGTLFGRNATGGVIQIITKEPTETLTADGEVGYADYNTLTTKGYVAGAIAPGITADLAVTYENQASGFGKNFVTDQSTFDHDDFAIRSKIVLTPSDETTIHVNWDYSRTKSNAQYQHVPGTVGIDGVTTYPGPFNSTGNFPMYDIEQERGVSLRVDQEFDWLRLASITSYRRADTFFQLDEDSTPLNIVSATSHGKQSDYTEELQLLSPGDSWLQWVTGVFYYNNKAGVDPEVVEGLAATPFPYVSYSGIQHTESVSGYAQGTAEIFDKTKLTLGIRYTREQQSIHSKLSSVPGVLVDGGLQSSTFWKPTWRMSLDHEFMNDLHGYVSYNRGIKSGGFDIFDPGGKGVAPESLDAYEIGMKGEFFEHKLRMNVAGFYYDYSNIQVTQAGNGFTETKNAAAARMYGLDMDFQALLTSALTVSGGLGLLNAKFTDFKDAVTYGADPGPAIVVNASNNSTPLSPNITANITADYFIPTDLGDFTLSATMVYNDGSFMDAGNRLRYPSYALVNSSVNWEEPGGVWGVRLWVKNLTDVAYYNQRYSTALGDLQMQAPPRTFGVTLRAHY
jgi:iron complex outermembrane receptor protein